MPALVLSLLNAALNLPLAHASLAQMTHIVPSIAGVAVHVCYGGAQGCIDVLQVSIALQKDGTVAIQTALDKALVQWPFLRDISLLSAITAVFVPATSPGGSTDTARAAAAAAAAGALDMTLLQPWLYYNILLLNSQLFVPVLDKVG